MRHPRRAVVAVALALCGCVTTDWVPERRRAPETFALLLNGGISLKENQYSHVRHLAAMRDALHAGGVGDVRISVLSGDGASPADDVTVQHTARTSRSWLLDATTLEPTLLQPLRHHSSSLKGLPAQPATRATLSRWWQKAATWLKPKDTLFVFVTDHGGRGEAPGTGTISLWDRESLDVRELGQLLALVDQGARVVTVMSQCYSGAFADLAIGPTLSRRGPGAACGFFSTTADRFAYGCYPDSRQENQEGHAFAFARALRRTGSLAAAHRATKLEDRTPDIPLSTSELFLSRFVDRAAALRGQTSDALMTAYVAEATAASPEDAALASDLARVFGVAADADAAQMSSQAERLRVLGARLARYAGIWRQASGELSQANLDEFLDQHPAWLPRLAPRAAETLTLSQLLDLQSTFLTALGAATDRHPGRAGRLWAGIGRMRVASATSFRAEVRQAGLLRLRATLMAAVGRLLVAREGTPADRRTLAGLMSCEAAALPKTPQPPPIDPPLPDLPSVRNDEALAVHVAPAWMGAQLGDLTPAERQRSGWPAAAVRVRAVEPAGPAHRAGLRHGDVLLGLDGVPPDPGGMQLLIAQARPGQPLALEVARGNERLRMLVDVITPPHQSEPFELPAAQRASLRTLRALNKWEELPMQGTPHLLFFWATWCKVCKRAVPDLLAFERQTGTPVVAITEEPESVVRSFLASHASPFPRIVALDPERRATEVFRVDAFPTFVRVDDLGRLRLRSVGYDERTGLKLGGSHNP